MTRPSFVVFGAPKCGTTALYHYVKQHPQIHMTPVKEPGFFDHDPVERARYCGPGDQELYTRAVTDAAAYARLFAGVTGQQASGEASVYYLYSPRAAARMASELPDVRLIAILRHPAERAYSAFLHNLSDGREPFADFARALAEEEPRRRAGFSPFWRYRDGGFYHAHLQPYLARFPLERIRLYLYEDFEVGPVPILQDVFRFLDVDETFVPEVSVRYNVSGVPKSAAMRVVQGVVNTRNPVRAVLKAVLPSGLRYAIRTRLRLRALVKPACPPEIRARLVRDYREDVLRLQDLIGRDLSRWLE